MSSSDTEILKAKQLYKSGNLAGAKELLVQIISNPNYIVNHPKLLIKLGDISVDLFQYEDAAKYYQQSLQHNPLDVSTCIKLGNVFQDYLNRLNDAETMYSNCIVIDENNEQCWFNYGRLRVKQNKFDLAEQCFLKCKTEKAGVNYHYGMLLSQQNHKKRAFLLLFKATQLAPKIIKYHYQYALILQNVGSFSEADKSFQQALELSHYQDAKILYDYAEFQNECLKDKELALCYLERAISIDPDNKYQFVRDKYNSLTQSKKQSDVKYDAEIKLLIYNFDDVIISGNTNYTGLPIEFMDDVVFKQMFFGKDDRIKRLRMHFKRILSSTNDISIAILSNNSTSRVRKILERVGLSEKLTVVGSDHDLYKSDGDILQRIIKISDAYLLNTSINVLFIGGQKENIELTSNHCVTFNTLGEKLSSTHMTDIEQRAGIGSSRFNKSCFWKWYNNGVWENFDVFASRQIDEKIEQHLCHSNKDTFVFVMNKGPYFGLKQNAGVYVCHVQFNQRRDEITKIFQKNTTTGFIRQISIWLDDEKTDALEMKMEMKSFNDNKELEKFSPHVTYEQAQKLQVGDKIDWRGKHGFSYQAAIDEIEMKYTEDKSNIWGCAKHKYISIRFVDGINQMHIQWIDVDRIYDHSLFRINKCKSISESINDRFPNIKIGDSIDINPIYVDVGWKPGKILSIRKGQAQVEYIHSITKTNQRFWLHLDNEVECAEYGKGKIDLKQVEALFHATIRRDKFVITEVRKIEENQDSIYMYESLLKLKCKNGQKPWEVEKYLWHGTDKPGVIIKNGFDRSYNKIGKFGRGSYFAKNASYSVGNGYCSKDNNYFKEEYCILLCRVIVGSFTVGTEDMKQIPKKTDGTEYDSLVNHLTDPTIFVSWRDFMAIPYYLVKFKSKRS